MLSAFSLSPSRLEVLGSKRPHKFLRLLYSAILIFYYIRRLQYKYKAIHRFGWFYGSGRERDWITRKFVGRKNINKFASAIKITSTTTLRWLGELTNRDFRQFTSLRAQRVTWRVDETWAMFEIFRSGNILLDLNISSTVCLNSGKSAKAGEGEDEQCTHYHTKTKAGGGEEKKSEDACRKIFRRLSDKSTEISHNFLCCCFDGPFAPAFSL